MFVAVVVLAAAAAARDAPAIGQYLGPAYPYELVSAAKADRIAWLACERGQRNVYTAAAPGFRPLRLTRFLRTRSCGEIEAPRAGHGIVSCKIVA